jgi:hypothetical protein
MPPFSLQGFTIQKQLLNGGFVLFFGIAIEELRLLFINWTIATITRSYIYCYILANI